MLLPNRKHLDLDSVPTEDTTGAASKSDWLGIALRTTSGVASAYVGHVVVHFGIIITFPVSVLYDSGFHSQCKKPSTWCGIRKTWLVCSARKTTSNTVCRCVVGVADQRTIRSGFPCVWELVSAAVMCAIGETSTHPRILQWKRKIVQHLDSCGKWWECKCVDRKWVWSCEVLSGGKVHTSHLFWRYRHCSELSNLQAEQCYYETDLSRFSMY